MNSGFINAIILYVFLQVRANDARHIGLLMTLLSLKKLSHSVENKRLFSDIDMTLDESSRVGLVGHNGCGKSTLLKIMAGLIEPDEGKVVTRNGARIELVQQFVPERLAKMTVFDIVAENTEGYVDPYSTGYLVEELLERLGFSSQQRRQRVEELSGGWVNRVLFGRAIAANPDFLILDEPTNHMDSESIVFFEGYILSDLSIPFCMVSHDRTLLDRCCEETYFLRHGSLHHFRGSYSVAKEALVQDELAAAHRRAAEEKEIKRLADAAKRLSEWGRIYHNEKAARQAKNIEQRIKRKKSNLTFVGREKQGQIQLTNQENRARFLIQSESVTIKTPNGRKLFHIEGFVVRSGERIVILGVNGSGKTTMLKTLVTSFSQGGDDSDFRFNPQVTFGYYDQELASFDLDATIFKVFRDGFPEANDDYLKTQIIGAGFPYERLSDPLAILSGGERARLRLLYLKLLRPNLLILDEPTNHIDVEGCEDLERQVLKTGLTCIVVSHDRRFVSNVASRYFLISEGQLREISDLDEYYEMVLAEQQNTAVDGGETNAISAGEANSQGSKLSATAILQEIERQEAQLEIEKKRTKKKYNPGRVRQLEEEVARLYKQLDEQI